MKAASRAEWIDFEVELGSDGTFTCHDGALPVPGRIVNIEEGGGWLDIDGRIVAFQAIREGTRVHVWAGGRTWSIETAERGPAAKPQGTGGNEVVAPMPGTVIKVCTENGAIVEERQLMFVLESMKMELSLTAPRAGVVEGMVHRAGDLVDMGTVLARIAPEEGS